MVIVFFGLMFHVMWNETWRISHVNENERKSLLKLNNNWNVFKWEKIEHVIGLSLSLSLSAHFMSNQIKWIFHIVCFITRRPASTTRFSQCIDFWWAQFHFRLASSSNNTISHQPNHTHQIFFSFSFLLNVVSFFNFLKLDLIFR